MPAEPNRTRAYSWSDPAIPAAAARTMAGVEFLRTLVAGELPPPPIAATLGFTLRSIEPGRAVFELEPNESHFNPIGSVHGGVYATLCDSACGCAVQSLLPAGTAYTSLDLNVRFVRSARLDTGPLRCEGTVAHLGRRTAIADARVSDQEGRLYATATSTCMLFSTGAPDEPGVSARE